MNEVSLDILNRRTLAGKKSDQESTKNRAGISMLRKNKTNPPPSYESLRRSWNTSHKNELSNMVKYFGKIDASVLSVEIAETAEMTDLDGTGFTLTFLSSEEVQVKFQLVLYTRELVEQALGKLAKEAHDALIPESQKKKGKQGKPVFLLPDLGPMMYAELTFNRNIDS
jgi:hypothetical protein